MGNGMKKNLIVLITLLSIMSCNKLSEFKFISQVRSDVKHNSFSNVEKDEVAVFLTLKGKQNENTLQMEWSVRENENSITSFTLNQNAPLKNVTPFHANTYSSVVENIQFGESYEFIINSFDSNKVSTSSNPFKIIPIEEFVFSLVSISQIEASIEIKKPLGGEELKILLLSQNSERELKFKIIDETQDLVHIKIEELSPNSTYLLKAKFENETNSRYSKNELQIKTKSNTVTTKPIDSCQDQYQNPLDSDQLEIVSIKNCATELFGPQSLSFSGFDKGNGFASSCNDQKIQIELKNNSTRPLCGTTVNLTLNYDGDSCLASYALPYDLNKLPAGSTMTLSVPFIENQQTLQIPGKGEVKPKACKGLSQPASTKGTLKVETFKYGTWNLFSEKTINVTLKNKPVILPVVIPPVLPANPLNFTPSIVCRGDYENNNAQVELTEILPCSNQLKGLRTLSANSYRNEGFGFETECSSTVISFKIKNIGSDILRCFTMKTEANYGIGQCTSNFNSFVYLEPGKEMIWESPIMQIKNGESYSSCSGPNTFSTPQNAQISLTLDTQNNKPKSIKSSSATIVSP